ncbi:mediator of RNA polymerase II transcription subunit 14-like [Cucurbita moschata]|uniref:Mediator of RNA polymerase II transcription subunit 14 n=1 Tax=Cucurbita moschata TaxID=3662 RepID=A0A6J1FHH7_CUCMO|nr:mediator of RNA polymerase II transcription subunit 14-like [Cucurbita moschata]
MAAELGQQTVELSALVSLVADDSFLSLKDLVDNAKSSKQSDDEKKRNILKYVFKTQQRMLRLYALAKWCRQVPLIQYWQQLASTLSSHDTCFSQAADSLFFMHEGLQQARAPIYDVPSATEILLTGTYERLPKCVEDISIQGTLNENQEKNALKKLEILVRAKLLEVSLPKEISEVKVTDGTALLRVDGEFKVLVTLGYRGHLSLWRILHLELLVGERRGLVKLEEMHRYALGDDLERRMAAAENPFTTLYSILHELCISLVMDTVLKQVHSLRQGRWRDAIRFEVMSDGITGGSTQVNPDGETDLSGLRTPGLKIMYWLDFDKNTGISDPGPCPFIKIEPGPDMQIKCIHSTFVIDPSTNKEAKFSLDQSCIDVEKLLLRALCCNKYTRLLEIQKELKKSVQICQAADDVVLQHHVDEPDVDHKKKDKVCDPSTYEGEEILRVRAYGSLFFTLRINTRNGRFLLQSSHNKLAPASLTDCEEALNQGSMSATDVFIRLRSRSVLHLFASISRFLGLEAYENGFSAVRLPKNISNGSAMLLMGFPDCGNSYFLLMQLDKDFKPQFKLLEARSDPTAKAHGLSDQSNVIRVKKIDIDQIQILEDELNLSLLDWEKLLPSLPNSVDNQTSENGHLSDISHDGSQQISGYPPSSFSSLVDDVFELEKGPPPVPTFSVSNVSQSFNSSASHYGSLSNIHNIKGVPSPKWEVGMQPSQGNNVAKLSNITSHSTGSLYSSSNLKGPVPSSSLGSISSGSGRGAARRLSNSKSEQDLASLRFPKNPVEVSSYTALDDEHTSMPNDTSKDGLYANRSSRLLSPPQHGGPRISGSIKPNGSRSSPTAAPTGSLRPSGSSSSVSTPVSQNQDSCSSPVDESGLKRDCSRKRSASVMLNLIPSLKGIDAYNGLSKRRKVSVSAIISPPSSQLLISKEMVSKTESCYGNLIVEANKGSAPSSTYVSALLHVIRHCSICIKHARLTSQMDALDIPYVEEVGLRNASTNIWFRLPFTRDDSWQHICLRLGRPGTMCWDVKIHDQHFRDLWELQKKSSTAPWGPDVRIANTSDKDSHISYDPEGVVLSYQSVKADSIEKLVADIKRLSNARMFAFGMRKLLGVRTCEKPEESNMTSDVKAPVTKVSPDTVDKLSEQMRRAFRIEAVGLMCLWFSFGSGVLARFVVEWESGKEGCTMHVSPDQLWPHTKFLEDFINGAEVASLLDCIRLTAGPLHALAAATRPARAGPVSTLPVIAAALSSLPKHGAHTPTQNVLPSSSGTITGQATNGQVGSTVSSSVAGPLANHSLHGAAMLAAAGRGGPGIAPSSLLPIDVSVVLRGPYWIRIIYRKQFAVDMRCFAGDQVWLQPATPAKVNPSIGGSLPCPQFRPFIMEHVAQELNGLEPNFPGVQQTVAQSAPNNQNPNSSSQTTAANGNRLSLPGSPAMSRVGNQVANVNRGGNALPGSSNLASVSSGLPLRRPPGAGVPAHVRGELNTAIIGLGDDGGYGGGWVPLVALKKVLRGILKYLGVLWLFAQLPDLLKEILGSILRDNEGALLNLDPEQPALRFFVGGYVFAVSVHRVQLLLQVLSVKRFHHQQQQQQQQNSTTAQEELTQLEISEICDYFSRRVASEPYDASRVASFITLLTLPISVLREFLKLIAWKKGVAQAQGGDIAPAQKPRIELCLENHSGLSIDENAERLTSKSNIHYDRQHNSVDFALTVVLDPAHIPHMNAAGGAAWLPYCISVKLKYSFGESPVVSFLAMEGSHGGRACWLRVDDWEMCKQKVARTVEVSGNSNGDASQGRLRIVADNVQRSLHACLQGLKEGSEITAITGSTS